MDATRENLGLDAKLDALAARYVRSANPAERQAATVLAALPIFIVAGRMDMVEAIMAALVDDQGQQMDATREDAGLIAELDVLAERYMQSDNLAERQAATVLAVLPIFISAGRIGIVAEIMAALVEDQKRQVDAHEARSRPL
jgi:hypothetical protein